MEIEKKIEGKREEEGEGRRERERVCVWQKHKRNGLKER